MTMAGLQGFRQFQAARLAGIMLLLPLLVAASQNSPGRAPGPVEVRVRVLDGIRFVDTLNLKDFEVLENGAPQEIGSMYVVHGREIVRKEEPKPAVPVVDRSYYLLFQTVDWDARLAEAVHYLFSSVLKPGDTMTLVTPWKPYSLQPDALATKSKEALSKGMQDLLRRDIQRGGGEYREVIRTLRRVSNAIDGTQRTIDSDMESTDTSASDYGIEQQLDLYRTTIKRIDSMRLVDEAKLVAFADSLRSRPGLKTVYFFYEREYRPEISPMTMQVLLTQYQDNPTVQGDLMDLFHFYRREATFNADRVKKAFADAGIVFNFIFMDKKSERLAGGAMREQSEDIFPGFRDVATATGGICEVSQNPAASFERAAAASESYYLLYYTPKNPATGGTFKTLEVIVKAKSPTGAGFSVSTRQGYYAR
jgi:hypothetical protein